MATATPKRIPLMAGNWKMNLNHQEAALLVQKLAWTLSDKRHDYGKVEVVVVPAMVTKWNGGRSSSRQRLTLPSRRIDLPLMVSAEVMKTTSSPSRTTQTGATCGLPSLRTTASLAVRAGVAETNSCHQPSGAAE